MLKIAVCEDNEIDSAILINFVEAYMNKRQLAFHIDSYSNGADLLSSFHQGSYHLIFLDIFMDYMNGIDVGKVIRSIDFQTEFIFCTSSSEYALESYDMLALGYLLKPFDVRRMELLLDRFVQRFDHLSYQTITVKCQYEDYTLRLNEIMYIHSDDKLLFFHLANGDEIRSYGKLSLLENQLSSTFFLRCHQRYIINMDYIQTIDDNDFIISPETRIPIRKHEFHKFKEVYIQYKANTKKSI